MGINIHAILLPLPLPSSFALSFTLPLVSPSAFDLTHSLPASLSAASFCDSRSVSSPSRALNHQSPLGFGTGWEEEGLERRRARPRGRKNRLIKLARITYLTLSRSRSRQFERSVSAAVSPLVRGPFRFSSRFALRPNHPARESRAQRENGVSTGVRRLTGRERSG